MLQKDNGLINLAGIRFSHHRTFHSSRSSLTRSASHFSCRMEDFFGLEVPSKAAGVILKTEDRDFFFDLARAEAMVAARLMIAFSCENKAAGITLVSKWRNIDGVPVRRDVIKNTSDKDITIRSFSSYQRLSGEFDLYFQRSSWCGENRGERRPLDREVFTLFSEGGRSCENFSPCAALLPKDGQDGILVLPEVLGDWRISAVKTEDTALLVFGPNDSGMSWRLEPGESAVLSKTAFLRIPKGKIERCVDPVDSWLHRAFYKKDRVTIPIEYNTWFYDFENLDEKQLSAQLSAAAEFGCEVFTVDAGWYGQNGSWSESVGDWRERTDSAFYGKMADFADRVRAAGLKFGLWIEPERFSPTCPAVLENPDFFLSSPSGFMYPDLENPDAKAYVLEMISEVIARYDVRWLKMDFNHGFGPDPRQKAHHGYTNGLRQLLSKLKIRFPEVIFEGCSSGGMRLDYRLQSRFDTVFLSDTVNTLDVLNLGAAGAVRLSAGRCLRWVCVRDPGAVLPKYGTRSQENVVLVPQGAIWEKVESFDIDFVLKTCLQGQLGFSGDLASLGEYAREKVKKAVAFAKEYRNFIKNGIRHQLTPLKAFEDRSGWDACCVEYNGSIILFASRQNSPQETADFRLPPKIIDPAREYTQICYDRGLLGDISGRLLHRENIVVEAKNKYQSVILVFKPAQIIPPTA